MWLIALRCKGSSKALYWRIFALLFLYLSIDDAAEIHERVGSAFGDLVESDPGSTSFGFIIHMAREFPSYYWQIVFLPIFAVLGGSLFVIIWNESVSSYGKTLLIIAILTIGFSQFLDIIEGLNHGYRMLSETIGYS